MKTMIVGGIPTEPDVKLLLAAFSGLRAGRIIEHGEIEEAIRSSRTTARYRTVTNAWRKRVEADDNLCVASVPGIGFQVLEESERAKHALGRGRRGIRQIGRAVHDIGRVQTEKLTETEAASTLHARRLMEGLLSSGRQTMKEISAHTREQQRLPRLAGAEK